MTPLKLLLITSTCLALSGCWDDKSQGDDVAEAQKSSHMEYTELPKQKNKMPSRPLNVRTLSGSYLIAQQAQANNDWTIASQYLNQFLLEGFRVPASQKEDLTKRAMILNLGAGKIKDAQYYAAKLPEEEISPLSVLLLTMPHIKNNDIDKALKELEQMSSGGLSDLIKPEINAWLVFAQGNVPELSEEMSAQERYHLILAADHVGKTDILKKIIGAEFPTDTLSFQSLSDVADIMVRHNLTGRALSLYQDLNEQSPDNKDIAQKTLALEKGENIPAEMLFSKVDSVEKGIALSLLDVGMFLFQEQSMDSTKIFAHMALALDPDLEDAQLLLAYVAASYEQYDEAINFFAQITKDDQERYVQAQRQISQLQEESKNLPAAQRTLDELALLEDTVELQIEIGDMARRADDYKKALKAYNHVFSMVDEKALDEEYWGIYYSRGIAYERLDQWNLAEKDLQKALSLEPNHPYVLNYLGYSWADQGKNLDKALNMITKAVNLRPNDGYIVDSLGWVYFKMEEFGHAVEQLEKAVELMPEDPTLNDHLGDAYWKVGKEQKAKYHWQRAFNFAEVGSDNLTEEEAKELINSINKKMTSGL
jgi:tetratricopeptide (TPR) repeat protein